MEINKEHIEQSIVRTVADEFMSDGELESRIKKALEEKIDAQFKEIAEPRIQEAVNRAITDGFEREYCRVDSFGRKQGEPTTIRKELERLITGYWNDQVDSQGKPTTNNYGTNLTRAEWTMNQLVAADFHGEMKQHIVNLGGALKDQLRGNLRTTLDRLLSEVFYVQSDGDRELGKPGNSYIQTPQTGKI
jgi:hypothetical protein